MVVGALVVAVFRITARLRKRGISLENSVRARDEEVRHLATVRLPALVEKLHRGSVEVPGPTVHGL